MKNGRTSLNERWYAVGEMVCWSISTFEKSGWIVPYTDDVAVTGTEKSPPMRDVVSPELLEPNAPKPYSATRGFGRDATAGDIPFIAPA